ncbi:MAG: AarF/ABC1/UbiB kinase family protein [Methanobacteriaceae archaeon]|nr:AarF/ABC1/UbiB kinase family protein [Methanobacteriaceae archaeon]
MVLSTQKKNIVRLNQITKVLIKYGFGGIVQKIGLKTMLSNPFNKEDTYDIDFNERVRLVLQELGTTFIKLGQTLSAYPNIISLPLANELAKLQDDTPATSYDDISKVFESDFNCSIDDIFEKFNKVPIASASIGQVHSAYFNNEHVAIKIQHPNIKETIETDISIMKYLAKKIDDKITQAKSYNLPGIVEEFERDIYKELDYTIEAKNIEHFRSMLKEDEVRIPNVYKNSTKHVLIMEFIKGIKLNTVLDNNSSNYDKKHIAYLGADIFFKQILLYGFYHADPHPGNIFILKNNRISLIDFGMIGHLDDSRRNELAKLFIFISDDNITGIIKQLKYMNIITEDTDINNVRYEIMDLMDKYYGVEFNDITGVLKEIVENDTLVKYGIVIPKDLIMVIRTISMVDDIGKKLYPKFNTTAILKPYAKKLITNNFKPKKVLSNINENYIELEHLISIFPDFIEKFYSIFNNGNIKLSLDYEEQEKLTNIASKISNQLSLALITSAMLIGSSLIMLTDRGFLIFGFPFLGFIGFIFSAILGIIVIIMIIRKGNY